MILALATGQPLSAGGVETWHPRDVVTAWEWVQAKRDAIKDARRGRR